MVLHPIPSYHLATITFPSASHAEGTGTLPYFFFCYCHMHPFRSVNHCRDLWLDIAAGAGKKSIQRKTERWQKKSEKRKNRYNEACSR